MDGLSLLRAKAAMLREKRALEMPEISLPTPQETATGQSPFEMAIAPPLRQAAGAAGAPTPRPTLRSEVSRRFGSARQQVNRWTANRLGDTLGGIASRFHNTFIRR